MALKKLFTKTTHNIIPSRSSTFNPNVQHSYDEKPIMFSISVFIRVQINIVRKEQEKKRIEKAIKSQMTQFTSITRG